MQRFRELNKITDSLPQIGQITAARRAVSILAKALQNITCHKNVKRQR
jgi:hypothetical protein